jgi:spore photoproduct lyase
MKNNIENLMASRFPLFGVNKIREISRLVFEISKREGAVPETLACEIKESKYESVKTFLLRRRYPETFGKVPLNSFYLPKYNSNENFKADISALKFSPKNVFYVKEARSSRLYENVKSAFAHAHYTEIDSLKSFLKNKNFTVKDYNRRAENLFLVCEKYDFFKKCPCTSNVVKCGYSIMNLGMGCPYECSYCFLQGYQNVPGMILPYNISDYLKEEEIVSDTKGFFGYKRIGSGEFTDSLVFDDITEFSGPIVDFFKNHRDTLFEFKTKSLNIGNLLKSGGSKNIVAAWSVNSLKMQKENEFKTPGIKQRLDAAARCAKAGFATAFHFDPIIPYDGWREGYKETVDMIFDIVPASSVKWISLGTLRMPARLKTVIENRFPENKILDGELLLGKDYKLRYDAKKRSEIYGFINEIIKSKKSKAEVYLCMEESEVWKKSGIM